MTAKPNRTLRCTATVLAVVALGAAATASGTSDHASAKAAAPSTAATGSSSAQQGGTQRSTAQQDPAGEGVKKKAQQNSRTDAANAPSPATGNRCHTGELNYSWASAHGGRPDMEATDQQIAAVRLTNRGARTCTLYGFPGIRLISRSGKAWDLTRSTDKPTTLTLHPGQDTALITMNILPIPVNTTDTRPFAPSKVLITPPDETTDVTLVWPYGGALWDQAGSTPGPESFVNPIGVG